MAQLDNLKRLLDEIRRINFWDRLFGWRRVKDQLMQALPELAQAEFRLAEQDKQLVSQGNEQRLLKQEHSSLGKRKTELELELETLRYELRQVRQEQEKLQAENNRLILTEELREKEKTRALASLSQIEERIRAERETEISERHRAEIDRLKKLKDTWSIHEAQTRSAIKALCQKHTIDYIDKVPFKGAPDNTLSICDEFVIFDAKSPGGEELRNFRFYLRDQAEKAVKYARQPGVRSDIFFVVPSNTLEQLDQFVFKFPDHIVYVLPQESLEPVMLSLKKIEDYEFAKELTPEDREQICRILGRFAHLSKRRIQVDNFFARQFIELSYKAEAGLPPDILQQVVEFERSEKLNPPIEKRAKAIPTGELQKESQQLSHEAAARGIIVEDGQMMDKINEVQLYKEE